MCLILICISGCAFYPGERPSTADIFERAGSYYQSGDYGKAIELYEKLRAGGVYNGVVYYNLGNSYLKKSDIGRAILNYVRAGEYIPRDSDLIANYRHSRTLMKQAEAKRRISQVEQEILRLFNDISLREAAVIYFMAYYLLGGCIVCIAVMRKWRILMVVPIIIVAASLVIAAIPLIDKVYTAEAGAIAVAGVTDAKKEPYDEAATSFPIYAGMKVYILKEGTDWFKVRRPDGRIGWVSRKAVERIW